MRRLLNKETQQNHLDELSMMQVACNRPIMLPLAVSIGNRRIKPGFALSAGRKYVPEIIIRLL